MTTDPEVWAADDEDVRPQGMGQVFDKVDARGIMHKNRAQRRSDARYYLGRQMRRNLHGWGRWRRALTSIEARWGFPFAERGLDHNQPGDGIDR
jgi:hypothetical protein